MDKDFQVLSPALGQTALLAKLVHFWSLSTKTNIFVTRATGTAETSPSFREITFARVCACVARTCIHM